jgi:copper chaperone NosL
MGAPEAVPFAERSAAKAFATRHGGEVVSFDLVPRDYVLAVVPMPMPMQHARENSTGKVVK